MTEARKALQEISVLYHTLDEEEKRAKTSKEKVKAEMLALMTEIVREEIPLANKTIIITQEEMTDIYGDDYKLWLKKNYPTWKLISIEPTEKFITLKIEENESFVKFEYTVGDYVFGRTVATSSPSFRAEDFYHDSKVVELGAQEVIDAEEVVIYSLNETKATHFMADNPESKSLFEKYIDAGSPSVRMLPIKPIQEEE